MSPLDHYAHRAALRARRLRVIEALMDGATGVAAAAPGGVLDPGGEPLMRWYLSGPMSGYPQHNRPQFEVCARLLRERGYDICNPVEFDEADGLPWIRMRSLKRALWLRDYEREERRTGADR